MGTAQVTPAANPWDKDVTQSSSANPWDKDVIAPNAAPSKPVSSLPPGVPDDILSRSERAIESGDFPGPMSVYRGIRQIFGSDSGTPRTGKQIANDAMEGGMKVLSPAMIPGLIAAPEVALPALAGSVAGQKGGQAIADASGASPETSRMVGNIGGIAGGAAGGFFGPRVIDAIPSTTRAGQNFDTVMKGASNYPIDTTAARGVVQRATELGQRGATVPKVIQDFGRATATNPVGSPGTVTYGAGRDFASNAGRMSVTDSQAANPVMARQVKLLANALDTANEGAANNAGLGDEYRAAMKEYRQAQQMKQVGRNAVDIAKKYILPAVGLGAAYKIGSGLVKSQ